MYVSYYLLRPVAQSKIVPISQIAIRNAMSYSSSFLSMSWLLLLMLLFRSL